MRGSSVKTTSFHSATNILLSSHHWRWRRLWFCVKGRPSNGCLADRPLCLNGVEWPDELLSTDEPNSDQAPQDINNEEFQLDHVRLQTFVAATDPGCKKELLGPAL
ncbi:hypothetical protein TNCV_1314831 [Trichonephila clavipes]|uniref:Uncharacterized protein n=1 Tax=Trichonephila clavipes TaxID=2585209 RepID=A0A8X6SIN5_TRICX|nr:hypothetical protein TNCV_1314831 [Trichonephila clavipes]